MAGKTTIKIMVLLALFALATGCSDSNSASPVSVDTAPPAVPSNLEATFAPNAGAVNLTWDANTVDADLAGYLVDKTHNGQTSPLFASPIQSAYCADNAPDGGVTVYQVYSVDFSGNESAVATVTVSVMTGRGVEAPAN